MLLVKSITQNSLRLCIVGVRVKRRRYLMKQILVVILFMSLASAFAVAPTQSAAGPVRITCEEGQASCQGRTQLSRLQTKRFTGNCPKRFLECTATKANTTVPVDMKCKSEGSPNVTCTIAIPQCNAHWAFCECTNWAARPNGAFATVQC